MENKEEHLSMGIVVWIRTIGNLGSRILCRYHLAWIPLF